MGIRGNSSTVRDMAQDIKRISDDLQTMSEKIRHGVRAGSGWEDDKAAQFNMAMGKVARMTEAPVSELRAALPKLEQLASLMDRYSAQNFS